MSWSVIVCGGRDYSDRVRLYAALDAVHAKKTISLLHHGAARGADTLAEAWAKDRGVPFRAWPADWANYGRAAGPRRNAEMLAGSEADLLVAFPGGTGTADMTNRCKAAGLQILAIPDLKDILSAKVDALVNPVNCMGVMGAGLALQFKQIYPSMFQAYAEACLKGQVRIGAIHVWATDSAVPKYIFNFPTKEHWQQPSRLEFIAQGAEALAQSCVRLQIKTLAVPKLGCGLGGLQWVEVKPLIEKALLQAPGTKVVFYER